MGYKWIFFILLFFTFQSLRSQSNIGIDPAYGDSGKVRTYLPAFGYTWGHQFSKKQSDNKIITARQFVFDLIITRHTSDGLLDYTWGTAGYVILDTNLGLFTSNSFLSLGDLRVQDDGKVLIIGSIIGSPSNDHQEVILRLNTDGSLDNSFDGDGIKITNNTNATTWGVIGACISENRLLVFHTDQSNLYQSFIKAYDLSDGSDDVAWGNSGELVFTYDKQSAYQQVSVQDDEKILLAGMNKMIRFLPNGNLDSQFAQNGKIIFDNIGVDSIGSGTIARNRFDLQSDKSIVISGIGNPTTPYDGNYVVQRIDSNGIIDNTFGGNGVVVINNEINGGVITLKDLLIQPDDGIVIVYEYYTDDGDFTTQQRHFALKRLHANGMIDSTFGDNGTIITSNFYDEYPYDHVWDAHVFDNGEIIVVGNTNLYHPGVTLPQSESYDINVLSMARYFPNGGYSHVYEIKKNDNVLKVYPNPANNHINIEFNDDKFEQFSFEVYTLSGQRVYYGLGKSSVVNSFDITPFSNGVYLLKIQSGEKVFRHKFVKQ